ncbi:MAG: AMP-binding protein, partial [Candidatus Magnetominusculus sp. LBB02]|nr:AMP-binding protein [Candidatus Magnetominusculus sp. LBB02]
MIKLPISLTGSSIFHRFIEMAARNAAKTAFIDCTTPNCHTYTYADILNKTSAIAEVLHAAGLSQGKMAAICAANSPRWCAAYLAISALGGISVPIDSEFGEAEIRNLIVSSGAVSVFTSRQTNEKVTRAVEGLEVRLLPLDSGDLNNIWEGGQGTVNIPECRAASGDTASIIYTSGTTSTPKGVVLTHDNFLSDAEAVIATGLITASDNVLSVLPAHHTYPFMCTFIVPLLGGGTVTYPPGLQGHELINTIHDQLVTILIGIPRLLEMFLNAIEKKIEAKPKAARNAISALTSISHAIRRRLDINAGRHIFKAIQGQFGGQFRFIASG